MNRAPSGIELGPGCTWQPGFAERGPLAYLALSYWLWLRHIGYDLAGRKPRKRKMPLS